MRAHDTQRSRVYAWERSIHGGATWMAELPLPELEQYVRRVWRSERGRVGLAKVEAPKVEARRGRSAGAWN